MLKLQVLGLQGLLPLGFLEYSVCCMHTAYRAGGELSRLKALALAALTDGTRVVVEQAYQALHEARTRVHGNPATIDQIGKIMKPLHIWLTSNN